jgi:HEAT repeat protein
MSTGATGKTAEDAQFAKLVKEIVKHLALSLRNVRSYPSGHPFVSKSLSETHELLRYALEGRSELVVVLFENALMIEGQKVDRKDVPAVMGFTKDMSRTDIRSITFTQAVTPADIQGVLGVLAMDKLHLKEAGGALAAFQQTGIKSVGLNEVEYGIITKKGSPTAETASLDWDSFIESLRAAGPSLDASPEQISDLLLKDQTGGAGSDGDAAYANMAKAISEMVSVYGEDRKAEFAKWFVTFVSRVKPLVQDKLKDKDAFESKMAALIRQNIGSMSDSDLIEAMMEASGGGGKKDEEDIAREARAFLDALAIQQEQKVDLLEKLQQKLLSQTGPGGPGVGGPGAGSGAGPGLGGASLGEGVVVTSKESLEKLKERAAGTLGTGEVDTMLGPFLRTLDDPSADVRRKGAESMGEMLLGLVDKERYLLAEKSILILKDKMEEEEDFQVYLAYVSVMEKIARKMRESDRQDIAEKIEAVFTEQISSEQKRKRAVQALGKVGGKDALISLISALWESGIYKEVRDAIVGMGKEAMPMVMEVFREAEDKLFRRRLIDLISNIGKEAIPFLNEACGDESWFVRRDIATVLGNIGDPACISPLKRLFNDKEYTVKEEALEAIAKIGGDVAEATLVEALQDPNKKVRDAAIKFLGRTSSEKAAASLAELALSSTDELFQKEICATLGQMGNQIAVEPLAQLLEETVFLGRHKHPDTVRMNAVYALAKIGGAAAEAAVERATKDKSRAVQVAAQSAHKRMKAAGGTNEGGRESSGT